MIDIEIGLGHREWKHPDEAEEGWVRERVETQRSISGDVCVRVQIHCPDVGLTWATSGCPPGRGVNRPLSPSEDRINRLWTRLGLYEKGFSANQLLGFFRQLENVR